MIKSTATTGVPGACPTSAISVVFRLIKPPLLDESAQTKGGLLSDFGPQFFSRLRRDNPLKTLIKPHFFAPSAQKTPHFFLRRFAALNNPPLLAESAQTKGGY